MQLDIDIDDFASRTDFLPPPHPGQRKLHESQARYRVLACGSRWGKSTAAVREGMAAMLKEDSLGWVCSTTYELSDIIFSQIYWGWKKFLPEMVTSESSISRGVIKLENGAVCQRKSADNPDSLLGRGLDWLIDDECALQKENIWTDVLQPRLIDRNGWALFTSTPKGKGWYWHLYLRGRTGTSSYDPQYFSMEGATWENPKVNRKNLELEKANGQWTDRAWQQEILGMFLDDSGAVFKNVRSHIVANFGKDGKPVINLPPVKAYSEIVDGKVVLHPAETYVMGVDLAKSIDWTVITVLNSRGQVVYWERLPHGMGWPSQRARIKAVHEQYNALCYVDSSGIGDPTMDDLWREGVSAVAVKTAQEKTMLIDALAVAMDNGKVTYPEIPILLNELEMYEIQKTATGRMSYNAPDGFHDDSVISLALAWRGLSTGTWTVARRGY